MPRSRGTLKGTLCGFSPPTVSSIPLDDGCADVKMFVITQKLYWIAVVWRHLCPWDYLQFLAASSHISTSSAFYKLTARNQMFSGLISNRSRSCFCCFSKPPQIITGGNCDSCEQWKTMTGSVKTTSNYRTIYNATDCWHHSNQQNTKAFPLNPSSTQQALRWADFRGGRHFLPTDGVCLCPLPSCLTPKWAKHTRSMSITVLLVPYKHPINDSRSRYKVHWEGRRESGGKKSQRGAWSFTLCCTFTSGCSAASVRAPKCVQLHLKTLECGFAGPEWSKWMCCESLCTQRGCGHLFF